MDKTVIDNINIYYCIREENQSDVLMEAVEIFRSENKDIKFDFSKNDKGRPVLLGTDYDISFTHSGSLCMAAIGKGRIGIDAELVRVINYDKIVKRFFSAHDSALVSDIESFFRLWTRYEARYKLDNSLMTADIRYYDVPVKAGYIITLAADR